MRTCIINYNVTTADYWWWQQTEPGVENKIITKAHNVSLAKVQDQNDTLQTSCDPQTWAWRANHEQWILHTRNQKVTESDFESELTILKERLLVPHAWQYSCSLYYHSKVLAGTSWCGAGQPQTLFHLSHASQTKSSTPIWIFGPQMGRESRTAFVQVFMDPYIFIGKAYLW
jgi:hypothetical protein